MPLLPDKVQWHLELLRSVLLLVLPLVAVPPAQASDDDLERPYSCRLYDAEQRKCGFDPACDRRPLERLRIECLRDGGRPGYSHRH